MATNWEVRLRPLKCDKKDDPQVYAASFPYLITLTEKEKMLNPKAMTTYIRPKTIGEILTNYKRLTLSKTREPVKGGQDLAVTVQFVVAIGNTTNQWYLVFRK